jgi:hypothetical protein
MSETRVVGLFKWTHYRNAGAVPSVQHFHFLFVFADFELAGDSGGDERGNAAAKAGRAGITTTPVLIIPGSLKGGTFIRMPDAIHLATALHMNVTVMNTLDGAGKSPKLGLPYQTYIKSLLHETLAAREKRKTG